MKKIIVTGLLASLLLSTLPAFAEDTITTTAATATATATADEWRSYLQPLESLGERFVPQMTDPQDPQLRRELYRALFSQISSAYLGLLFVDPQHPEFWPYLGPAYNFAGVNPDTIYYATPLDDKGVYKISGFRGTVKQIDFQIGSGSFIPRGQIDAHLAGLTLANYDLDSLKVKKNAPFEVILSATRPDGYKGHWWKLDPTASYILARQVSYDWLHEVDGRLIIERLDKPVAQSRQSTEQLDANLKQVAKWTEDTVKLSFAFIKSVRKEQGVNRLAYKDLSEYAGRTTQKYAYGGYDLAPDEALIIEAKVPQQCNYWSVQLLDDFGFSTDWVYHQTSINGYTAKVDKDGVLRTVISAQDPGIPNWLDTQGYRTGAVQVRWEKCSNWPEHTVRKVKTAEVRNYLPAATPSVSAAARDAALLERRRGALLRKRW